MDAAPLVAAFVFGLAGSLHCVGMCGPLVLLLAQDEPVGGAAPAPAGALLPR